jgi:hypothetical protein
MNWINTFHSLKTKIDVSTRLSNWFTFVLDINFMRLLVITLHEVLVR